MREAKNLTSIPLIRSDGTMIDLGPLKAKLGDAWTRYGPSVHRIASRIINQELSGTGSFVLNGDRFELTLPNMTGEATRREVLRIAAKLDGLLEGSAPEGPTPAPRNDRRPGDPPWANAAGAQASNEPRKVDVVGAAASAKDRSAEPRNLPRYGRTSRAMERAMDEVAAHFGGPDPRLSAIFPPADLRIEFRPFWDTKNKLLGMYGITPSSSWRRRLDVGYMSILPRSFGAGETVALDTLLLDETVATLRASQHIEHQAIAITSLHAMTLQDASACSEYFEACKTIPEQLRARLLFEVVGMDSLLGSAEAYGKILRLWKFGRGVLGRASIKSANLSYFKAIRLLALGFDLSGDARPESDLIQDMELFAVIAGRSKLESYARGLGTVSLMVAATAAGIGYIEGAPLNWTDDDHVLKVRPFRTNDLYGVVLT